MGATTGRMSDKPPASTVTDRAAERRRGPRMENADAIRAELISVRARLRVPEIGLGGFSVESAFPLKPGSVYRFRFSQDLADEMPSRVRARAVHSRRASGDDESPLFVTGLAFVDDRPRDRDAVGRLIDRVTSRLAFELS